MQGGVGVADDGDLSSLVERPVADGAVVDAFADEIFPVVFCFQVLVFYARGDDDALCGVFVVLRSDEKALVRPFFDRDGFFYFHFGAEVDDLFEEVVCERFAADLLDRGEVFEARGSGDLSAEAFAFEDEHAFSVSAGVERGGHARRAPADHDDVKHISRCSRCIF